MQDFKTSPDPSASRLMKFAETIGLIGFLGLFIGPLVVLPQANSQGSIRDVVCSTLAGFGVPLGLLLVAYLLAQLAIYLEKWRV